MVKIAVIGAGHWGKNIVRNFCQLGNLCAICDESPEILKAMGLMYPSIKLTKDYMEILNDKDIQGVAIATSDETHYHIAEQALAKGKDVFIEKPMTTTLDDAKRLADIIDKDPDKIVMVGHLMLYHPSIIEIKKLIESGGLGEISYLYSKRVDLGKVMTEKNVIWSLGVHDVAMFLYLINSKVVSVTAQGRDFLQKGIEDIAFLNMNFENNIFGHVHVSWMDPLMVRKTTVVGKKKMAVFDGVSGTESLKIYDQGVITGKIDSNLKRDIKIRHGDISVPYIEKREPLNIECKHFIDCIENRANPISDVFHGLEVINIMDCADKAIEKSIEIKLQKL